MKQVTKKRPPENWSLAGSSLFLPGVAVINLDISTEAHKIFNNTCFEAISKHVACETLRPLTGYIRHKYKAASK